MKMHTLVNYNCNIIVVGVSQEHLKEIKHLMRIIIFMYV